MTESREMTNPAGIVRFVEAGNARVTLSSKKTGARYTYRVSASGSGSRPVFFVSLLTGPDNGADFQYLGIVDRRAFRLTARSRLPADSKPVAAFRFFCDSVLAAGKVPPALEVRHEGRCGRCARALTVPESIDRGIGPDCWEQMGLR